MVQSKSTIFSLPANQIPALAIESYVLRFETPICRSLRPSLATSLLSGRVPCLLSLHRCRRPRSWRPLSSYAILRATQRRARPQRVPRDRPISRSNSALPRASVLGCQQEFIRAVALGQAACDGSHFRLGLRLARCILGKRTACKEAKCQGQNAKRFSFQDPSWSDRAPRLVAKLKANSALKRDAQ